MAFWFGPYCNRLKCTVQSKLRSADLMNGHLLSILEYTLRHRLLFEEEFVNNEWMSTEKQDNVRILFCTILRHFCIFLSAIRLQSVTDNVRLSNGSPQFLSVYELQSQHLMANAMTENKLIKISLELFSSFTYTLATLWAQAHRQTECAICSRSLGLL